MFHAKFDPSSFKGVGYFSPILLLYLTMICHMDTTVTVVRKAVAPHKDSTGSLWLTQLAMQQTAVCLRM